MMSSVVLAFFLVLVIFLVFLIEIKRISEIAG